jgi:ribonucleoside-diphosphate reductase beta chain
MTPKQDLTSKREYFKPFNYPWAYDAWLKHEQSHWLHTEVPMAEDVKDWKTVLTPAEKSFLTNIFRFFTQGDIDVADGYVTNYLPYFPQPEVRMMLSGFAAREALHVAAYSHLIETLGMPESTYSEFLEYQAMADKHEYFVGLSQANGTKKSIAVNIAAFSAFTEGMQLFSSFIMLLNFARHGKMKGMGQIITWSIVDETMHAESMIKLFRTYVEENLEIWNDELKKEIYTVAVQMVVLE